MQTDATSHNIVACCWGVFGQQCCVRLHGPKSLTGFKLYATSANKCQHRCDSMQTDATCWTQQYSGADPGFFERGGPEAMIYKILERGGPKSLKMAFECSFQSLSYKSFANIPQKGGTQAPWAPPLNPPLILRVVGQQMNIAPVGMVLNRT